MALLTSRQLLLFLLLHFSYFSLGSEELAAIEIISPPDNLRLSATKAGSTNLEVTYKANVAPTVYAHFGLTVCLNVAGDLTFSGCFKEYQRTLQLRGLQVGTYRISLGLQAGETSIPGTVATVSFVVAKEEFVPSYEWGVVEAWQSVPGGLEVTLPLDGTLRRARIPTTWQLRIQLDGAAAEVARVDVGARSTLREVRAALARISKSKYQCVELKLDGRSVEDELATVEGVGLFGLWQSGLVTASVRYDRQDGCECGGSPPCAVHSDHDAYLKCVERCAAFGTGVTIGAAPGAAAPWRAAGNTSATGTQLWRGLLSTLSDVERVKSVPGTAQWARCRRCAFEDGNVLILAPKGPHDAPMAAGSAARSSSAALGISRHAQYWPKDVGTNGEVRARRVELTQPNEALLAEIAAAGGEASDAHLASALGCTRVVRRVALAAPVWSVHNVYHLLVDLMQPAHATLSRSGDSWRLDAALFLEIGHAEQRSLTPELLRSAADPSADVPLRLLGALFAPESLHSLAELRSLPGRTCFTELWMGVDMQLTGHAHAAAMPLERAVLRPPLLALPGAAGAAAPEHEDKMPSTAAASVIERQLAFKLVLHRAIASFAAKPPWRATSSFPVASAAPVDATTSLNVVFVNRRGTRRLRNLAALKRAARASLVHDAVADSAKNTAGALELDLAAGEVAVDVMAEGADEAAVAVPSAPVQVKDVVVERLRLSQQVALFRGASVLVCVHGQGCTNTAFMRAGTALVLIMPRGWFGWKWMYANLALAFGVHVVVWQPHGVDDAEGWTGEDDDYLGCDSNGYHPVRDPDLEVDPDVLKMLVRRAAALVGVPGAAQSDLGDDPDARRPGRVVHYSPFSPSEKANDLMGTHG